MKIFLIDLINRNPLVFAKRQFLIDIDNWHDFFNNLSLYVIPKSQGVC